MSKSEASLIGWLTREPELKYVGAKNTAVCQARMACDVGFGERKSTNFIDVVFWGRHAEILCEYLSKGSQLAVDGDLVLDTWQDKKTGDERKVHRVRCRKLTLLASASGGGNRVGAGQYSEPEKNAPPPPSAATEEEIPF